MTNKKIVKKKDVIKLSHVIFFPYMEGKQNRKQLYSNLRRSDKSHHTSYIS